MQMNSVLAVVTVVASTVSGPPNGADVVYDVARATVTVDTVPVHEAFGYTAYVGALAATLGSLGSVKYTSCA